MKYTCYYVEVSTFDCLIDGTPTLTPEKCLIITPILTPKDVFSSTPTPTPTPKTSMLTTPTPTPTPMELELESEFGVQCSTLVRSGENMLTAT